MWIIFLIVILSSLYCTLSNKNNRVLNIFLVVCMAILAAAPRVGYDTGSFQNLYNKYAGTSVPIDYDIGRFTAFIYLMRFLYAHGINTLYMYKFVVMLVLFLWVERRSRKITSNFSMWVFFYACSLMTLDAIQFRNSISLCLMIIAFSYLVEGGRRNDIIFCLFMLVATIMHVTFIVYFTLLIAKYADKTIRRYAEPLLMGSIGFISICYMCRPILEVLILIPSLFLSSSKHFMHFFKDQAHLGFIIVFVIYVAFALMLLHINNRYRHISDGTVEVEKHRREHAIILNEMILLFPLMVLCLYSVAIERFLRNLIVFCLFSMCNYIQDCPNRLERRNVKIALFLVCAYVFIYQNYLTGPASDIVEAVLKGEWFFA